MSAQNAQTVEFRDGAIILIQQVVVSLAHLHIGCLPFSRETNMRIVLEVEK
jgi:hypothetical protein